MTDNLAFDISAPDMIRNTAHLYTTPFDYVDAFITQLYGRGSADITVQYDGMRICSEATLDERLLQRVAEGSPLAVQKVMPPSSAFDQVTISSGKYRITIDKERNISVETNRRDPYPGPETDITIDGYINRAEAIGRLTELYTNSDMDITLNGDSLTVPQESFKFKAGDVFGRVVYNSCSSGGLHFFHRGRFIGKQDRIGGLDVLLYSHPFPPTITRSRIITSGDYKEAREKLDKDSPRALIVFAKYSEADRIYEMVLNSLARRFDDPDTRKFVRASREALRKAREAERKKREEERRKAEEQRKLARKNGSKPPEDTAARENGPIQKDDSIHDYTAGSTDSLDSYLDEDETHGKRQGLVRRVFGRIKSAIFPEKLPYAAIRTQIKDLTGVKVMPCPGETLMYRRFTLYVGEALLENSDPVAIALQSIPLLNGNSIKRYQRIVEISRK